MALLGGFERESTNPVVIESPVVEITIESDANFIIKYEGTVALWKNYCRNT